MPETKNLQATQIIIDIKKRISDNSDKIRNRNNAVQFAFADAESYWLKNSNGKVEQQEKANRKEEAVVTLTCTLDALQQILDNKLGAVRALVNRKVKVDGSILAIRKLRQGLGIN